MLLGKNCRGTQECDLTPFRGGSERRPQSNLRFAEPHVSAYKPIHRFGLFHISQDVLYGFRLIRRFLEAEGRFKFTVQLPERRIPEPLGHLTPRIHFNQVFGDFFDSLAGFFLAGLPGSAAQTIQRRLRFSPALAYRVYDEFDEGCVTRGADGSLVVSVSFPEDPWLYGYLLSFGLGVEVLEPERLRKRLALLAGKMAAHHGNHDTGCQDNCDRMESSQSQEESHMNHTFCQSCGMPIDDPALRGTERGGTPSEHYCKYCSQEGAFTGELTMEEMIDFCPPLMVRANPELTPEQARAQMAQFFPSLLRWRN